MCGTISLPSASIWRTSSGGTAVSSGSSVETSVVPSTQTVCAGTRMSLSAGMRQRFTTACVSRWFSATMMPRPPRTRTSQPAIAATLPAQAPVALTVISARTSASSPVRASRTRAPRTASPSTISETTSWRRSTVPPRRSTSSAHTPTSRHVSTAASGTEKARVTPGWSRGSRRRASPAPISSAAIPASAHAATKPSA